MNRAQAVVVLVAVALAVALAGVGLYADGRAGDCTATVAAPRAPPPGAGIAGRFAAQNARRCIAVANTPLTHQAARWWWFGAGAALVLGAAALPLAGRRGAGR